MKKGFVNEMEEKKELGKKWLDVIKENPEYLLYPVCAWSATALFAYIGHCIGFTIGDKLIGAYHCYKDKKEV